ncbi:hypothetical protein PISMIDRAFT_679990 [Pisolithus microcarpus 441]|uniref:Uncharacterized protein n=1 Tax=Pisolithus microcarpus 441 TaxID=765257 RepID=A0A0C9YD63_9AGAM|nr:hypothetical protein PISMIDRAFT_679990 [Pisolithus microcarpus 441]
MICIAAVSIYARVLSSTPGGMHCAVRVLYGAPDLFELYFHPTSIHTRVFPR